MEESCWCRVLHLVRAFVYFIIFFIPFLLLFLIASLFCIWRLIVGLFLRRKYGQKIVFLNGLDAMCAVDFEKEPMNVTAVLKLNGKANVEYLQQIVLQQMVEARDQNGQILHPTLKQYVHQDCGYYFWLSERHFNIEDHVLLYQGTCPQNEQQFDDICAKFCTRRSQFGKSPWQFIVIPLSIDFPGMENQPHYRIILSLLHAMADGVSLVRLITTHLLDEPYNEISPVHQRKNNQSLVLSIGTIIKTIFFLPQALYKQLMISDQNPLHGKQLSGVKYIGFSKPTPLERVQRVRKVTKTTINDVLMSCIAGALRSYFNDIGTKGRLLVTSIVPIAKHDYTKNPELKNSCSFVPLTLPVDVADAMRRLVVTKKSMSDIKQSPNFYFNFYGFQFLCNRLPKSLTRLYLNSLHITCIVSNVPGCQKCHTMCNKHLIEGAGFILPNRGKVGVGISLLTFNNHLQVGLIIDESLLNKNGDVEMILNNFDKELQILENETANL